MISEQVKGIADRFGEFVHTGMQLGPEQVQTIHAVLRAVVCLAREMEATVVPPAARLTAADIDGVKVISMLERRGGHDRRQPGGDAA